MIGYSAVGVRVEAVAVRVAEVFMQVKVGVAGEVGEVEVGVLYKAAPEEGWMAARLPLRWANQEWWSPPPTGHVEYCQRRDLKVTDPRRRINRKF